MYFENFIFSFNYVFSPNQKTIIILKKQFIEKYYNSMLGKFKCFFKYIKCKLKNSRIITVYYEKKNISAR